MKEKYLPNKKYYNFSTNCCCGVVVDKATMKKIQKVLYKAESEIKNILHNAEDVRPYAWSLVNIKKDGKILKQRVFQYPEYLAIYSKEERINNLKLTTPEYMREFYEIKNNEELADLKQCLLKELQEEQDVAEK